MEQGWAKYFSDAGDKPSSLVTLAVAQIYNIGQTLERRGVALDIGSGNGRDLKYLATRGFGPLIGIEPSLDAPEYPEGILRITMTAQEALLHGDEFVPNNSAALVVSVNTLFFIGKEDIHRLLTRIQAVTAPGGIYAFNVLGEFDQWVEEHRSDISFFTRSEINALKRLHPYIRECYSGNERDGTLMNGNPHHWHLHNFVCQKPV